ncbi:Phenazine biosynthesis-like domain-containing protein 1 [Coccomyxa sp. Obi]|nr:Phenazine biosynthesis-like domain-containing protein 1 [Coccomyxa sp. Obi]
MSKSVPLYQVDAFTAERFRGNPAAVCILNDASHAHVDDLTKSKIAAEMNLSETAFLEPSASGEIGSFKLRWFTPTVEVDLCGHATIAASAALLQGEGLQADELHFETRSGTLTVKRTKDGLFHLSVPSLPPIDPEPGTPEEMCEILEILGVGNIDFEASVHYCSKLRYLMVMCDASAHDGSVAAFKALAPDYRALHERCKALDILAVMVTATDPTGTNDLLLRFFAPAAGIDEDPVTGSAYAVAGPFWAQALKKQQLRARQCSPRGGDIIVTVDATPGRVDVAGSAVIVSKGVLYLD